MNTKWNTREFFETATDADVEAELAVGASPNARSEDGGTPLHRAAAYGSLEVVKALIASGARPKARDIHGWTPLHALVRSGRSMPGIVETLLDAGVEIDARDDKGWSALFLTAYLGLLDVAKILVERTADVNAISKGTGCRSVMHAAACATTDTSDIIRLLAAHRAMVNMRDVNGQTPLHLALSERDERGQVTPILHEATGAVVDALITAGADPNMHDNAQKTPWSLLQGIPELRGSELYWKMNEVRFVLNDAPFT